MEEVDAALSKAVPERSGDGALYRARPHPLALIPPGVALAIAVALALAAWRSVPALMHLIGMRADAAAPFETAWRWFLIIVPAIVACNLLLSLLELRTTAYAVTETQVTMRSGLLRITSATIYLQKVESMVRDQGPLERLFDTGTITLVGTGGGRDTLTHVRDLSKFVAALERTLPPGA